MASSFSTSCLAISFMSSTGDMVRRDCEDEPAVLALSVLATERRMPTMSTASANTNSSTYVTRDAVTRRILYVDKVTSIMYDCTLLGCTDRNKVENVTCPGLNLPAPGRRLFPTLLGLGRHVFCTLTGRHTLWTLTGWHVLWTLTRTLGPDTLTHTLDVDTLTHTLDVDTYSGR